MPDLGKTVGEHILHVARAAVRRYRLTFAIDKSVDEEDLVQIAALRIVRKQTDNPAFYFQESKWAVSQELLKQRKRDRLCSFFPLLERVDDCDGLMQPWDRGSRHQDFQRIDDDDERDWLGRIVSVALLAIDADDLKLVSLRFVHGFGFREIAKEAHLSRRTVRKRLRSALVDIRTISGFVNAPNAAGF